MEFSHSKFIFQDGCRGIHLYLLLLKKRFMWVTKEKTSKQLVLNMFSCMFMPKATPEPVEHYSQGINRWKGNTWPSKSCSFHVNMFVFFFLPALFIVRPQLLNCLSKNYYVPVSVDWFLNFKVSPAFEGSLQTFTLSRSVSLNCSGSLLQHPVLQICSSVSLPSPSAYNTSAKAVSQ